MLRENRNKYDLIIMDLQMPLMNGYEATKLIKEELNLKIPIIAMSATSCKIEKEKCMKIGMDNYFEKPFDKIEFFAYLNFILKDKIEKLNNQNEYGYYNYNDNNGNKYLNNNNDENNLIIDINNKDLKLNMNNNNRVITNINDRIIDNNKEFSSKNKIGSFLNTNLKSKKVKKFQI